MSSPPSVPAVFPPAAPCSARARLGGLVLAAILDALLADPARHHPVAGFGGVAARVEATSYRDSRLAGTLHTALLVAAVTLPAAVTDRRLARRLTHPSAVPLLLATAGLGWVVLGGTSLRRAGRRIGTALADGDLAGARTLLPTLCGRDPANLDESALARGAIESIAENTCDAVVAPLWWGAVAGLPGLAAYRAVNTLDAMIGHHSPRYERFGYCAARLDDLANLIPARIGAFAACVCAPLVGGNPVDAYWVLRRDGRSHPSPNAGPVEAAFAGALGLRLGGELRYPYRVEHRPQLGFGRAPTGTDIAAAARLSAATGAVSLAVTVLAAAAASTLRALVTSRPLRRPRQPRRPRHTQQVPQAQHGRG
ncbi:cobalamin biosynthesis protein [Candidatus Frankia nodulisporulans]|uniref:cobalamin biosynthesis protein n=1 Tax=Candidatus Frankia nodulisporulans TaxID=2060052 RepID=UPI001CDCB5F2|nr:cobalamin biosynthesis protein [Candidatus Frankia nodulisporulans]